MCRVIFLSLFLMTVYRQVYLQWKHDDELRSNGWLVLWKGSTKTRVETGSKISFNAYSKKYGHNIIHYDALKNSFESSERTEIFCHLQITLHAPPLSFHRLVLNRKEKEFHSVNLFVPFSGKLYSDSLIRMNVHDHTDWSFDHYFDSEWEKQGEAKLSMVVSFRSGIPNLYDTPWVYI